MRRDAPRPVGRALSDLVGDAAPPTLLARVQSCWEEVVGKVVATEAAPVGETAGRITVACSSATWAQELKLLSSDLCERLNDRLGQPANGPVRELSPKVRGSR